MEIDKEKVEAINRLKKPENKTDLSTKISWNGNLTTEVYTKHVQYNTSASNDSSHTGGIHLDGSAGTSRATTKKVNFIATSAKILCSAHYLKLNVANQEASISN